MTIQRLCVRHGYLSGGMPYLGVDPDRCEVDRVHGCEACGAFGGEPCDPFCLGVAATQDECPEAQCVDCDDTTQAQS